jgi:PKD repeat protein
MVTAAVSPAGGTIVWNTGDATTATSYTYTVTNSCGSTSCTNTITRVQGTIGNYVWSDLNNNGINDEPTSAGLNGVTVELWNATTNTLVSSTTTANNGGNPGYYNFVICNDGDYYVKFPVTNGVNGLTIQTPTAGTDNNSDANIATGKSPVFTMTLTGIGVQVNNPTIDAGYVTCNKPSAGSDMTACSSSCITLLGTSPTTGVWTALSTNGAGASLGTTSGGAASVCFVQSASGTYSFVYTVTGGCSDTINVVVATKPNAGADAVACGGTCMTITGTVNTGTWTALSSNATGATLGSTTLGVAQVCFTPTASGTYGFIYTVGSCSDTMQVVVSPQPNAGADKVTCYNNGNGTVNLSATGVGTWYAPSSNPGTSIITNAHFPTTTVTNFSTAGTYAYLFIKGSCADTMNVVVTPSGTIGNYVWSDTNADGLFNESTSNGLNGVTVDLYKDNGTGTFVVDQTAVTANDQTGRPGYYNFVICNDGNYKVKFPTSVNGSGLTIQTPTAGVDNNSDADVTTGFSPVFTINTNGTGVAKDNPTIDAGYKVPGTTSCNMSVSVSVNQLAQCVTNNSYQFTSTVTGGVGPYTYLWDFNDGTYGNTANPTHVYATSGEHDVTLIVKDSKGCEAHASTIQLYVGAKPVASFDIYDHSGSGAGISFSSTSTIAGGWLTYRWDLGNGTTSTLSNPGPIYYAPGDYAVTLIATGNFGCSDTITKTIHVNGGSYCIAPTAAFTINNATQCLTGNSFTFTNSSVGTPTSYVWNFGDGSSTVSTVNASHVYTVAGTYTVSLKATNGCGTSTITKTVIVNDVPATPSAITGPTSVSVGSVMALSHACNCGKWSSSNPSAALIDSNGVVLGVAAGTTTIRYTVTNGCGTSSVSYVVTVTSTSSVCVAPAANFTIDAVTKCLTGSAFVFTNTSTGVSPSYTWSFGDGGTSTNTDETHSYLVTGTYNVTLTATNLCGTSAITKVVTVVTTPAQPAAISGTTTIEAGSTSTLTSATTGGAWISSNTAVATVNPTTGVVTGVAAGTATITYTVSNACGTASRTATVTITTPIVPCVLPSTPASIGGTTTLTVGSTTTLSSATSGGVWSSSNTSVATINPSTGLVTAVGTGTTTISYTVTNACGSASVSTLVTVNTACVTPVANFTINNASQCITGNSFVFTNTTTGTAASYTWNFGNGSSTATSPTNTYTTAGTYTVTLQASSACGGSSMTKTVTVLGVGTAPAAIGGTPTVPVGGNTSLSSATTGGVWTSSNTAVATVNNTTGVVSGVSVGTATITYTINTGCGTTSTNIAVTVTAPCGAATSSTTAATICAGTTYTFNGVVYSAAGSYTAHLTNAVGCDSTATLVLTVNPLPTVAAISGSASLLVNGTGTYTDATVGGAWSSSNTGVATISSTGVLTAVSAGTVTISYTVSNACGSTSATKQVTVTPSAPCNLVANFTINNVRQCVTDNSFVLTNTTTGGTAPYTYLWDLNDGTTASTRDVTKSYATYGEHDITLRVSDANGCVSHANAQQLYVGARPVANFTVINNTGSGLSKTFVSSSTIATGTMSYLWDFGTPSIPNSTLANPTVTFAAGAYNVKLTVSGLGTCKDEKIQTITETGICVVSAYPNPVVNIVDVSFRSASATLTTVKIMDLQGRVLQLQTVMPAYVGANVVATINTSGLQSGVYVIDVSDLQNGHLTSKTIIKQ